MGSTDAAHAGLVDLPGGTFAMGTNSTEAVPGDGEGPVRPVTVAPFAIDRHAVSVERFAAFVAATGHVSDAERLGWSFVFEAHLAPDVRGSPRVVAAPWWAGVDGASWRTPHGPGSEAEPDHPVVHVSWADAQAYCTWVELRLPTEAEWEYAARGGLVQARFPWGEELTPGGEHRANIWQGDFPRHDSGADGFTGTAPVGAFAPNGFGLHQTSGNVWEWCADAWGTPAPAPCPSCAPAGQDPGAARVIRGGSYLCHASYCHRYRVSARSSSTPDSSAGHQGFRVAADR